MARNERVLFEADHRGRCDRQRRVAAWETGSAAAPVTERRHGSPEHWRGERERGAEGRWCRGRRAAYGRKYVFPPRNLADRRLGASGGADWQLRLALVSGCVQGSGRGCGTRDLE